MYAMSAMKQYQQVGVNAQVTEADPHRLIQMLMQGGLDRIAQAKGAMERKELAEKGELIGKAINIIGGLRDVLDKAAGGELADNLDRLYEYMTTRLFEASRHNDVDRLDEVSGLLAEVKSGWDGIAGQAR
ncbi:flagellar export chaperone FliS [Stutzerimonas chloritidismutans]|uniref:flagellar export chaperone FliS n=1 Tax=Stutzerimonas chloritidismutans TaxID=203192 RepID=UPI003F150B07